MISARALIEISAHSVLKKEVTMAISDEEGDVYTKEVIRVVYEWKPPHCVNCQSFGHDPNLCPKLVREKIPKTSAMDVKANTMEENDDGFVEVKSRKKKKGADSRSFGGLGLNKPNSKVIWQQKKGMDAKGGSNSASPSVSTNDNEKGNGCLKLDLDSSNPFDVLNVEGEEMGDSGQQPKVSEHVGTESLNVNKKKAQEPSSSKLAINDVQKDKNVSSSPALKTWDCINESDTDDEDVIPSYGSSLGCGNQLEDKDFDFSDGYEDQVVDFPGQLKEFRDFKLSMCGFCVFVALFCRYLCDAVAIMESLSLSSLASSLLKVFLIKKVGVLVELLRLPLLPAFCEASEIPRSEWLIVDKLLVNGVVQNEEGSSEPLAYKKKPMNAVAQAISTPLQRLPTANQQHVGTSRTITTRPVTNETSIPIFKIFDHFRNMHPDNLKPNPMNRRVCGTNVWQPLFSQILRGIRLANRY
ncbi:hypothetical protein Tco_0876634 [Tanacetum coccineum]|uniref:DUF4283 domain-containing protein n=1 Tax=Tanacetum coccineum TaxID=301880 RepID=A0ABQ5BWC4_9ASTR